MLGLQGNSSSSKVYRCVACSATFNGLAALLVHQATHANDKHPAQPPKEHGAANHATPLANKDSASKPLPGPAPTTAASSLFICDCGDEFQDFNLMLEHKSLHVSSPLNIGTVYSVEEKCEPASPRGVAVPALDSKVDAGLKGGGVATVTAPQDQGKSPQDPSEKMSTAQDPSPQATEDKDKSVPGDTISPCDALPKNQTLMKMLATAYMKRFQPPEAPKTGIKPVLLKTEVIPVEIVTQPANSDAAPGVADPSVGRLRRLLTKPGLKTKSPGVGRILDSSSKSIVSLTRTFSPVVVLETRQKLIDVGSDGKEGRYQCSRCRRVFQDLDSLTEHHSLHRKEKIKCCRHCKQLIIGKPPFPDNHICPQLSGRIAQQASSFISKFSLGDKIRPFHNLSQPVHPNKNTKRVFFCPVCKHNYARRYNLTKHKCQGPNAGASLPLHMGAGLSPRHTTRANSKSNGTDSDENEVSRDIAVGTDTSKIKVEKMSDSGKSEFSDSLWVSAPKSFPPFRLKASSFGNTTLSKSSLPQEDKSAATTTACPEENDGGQWTMPLDDDMEALSAAEDADSDPELKEPLSPGLAAQSMPFFIRDGVKRYPCNSCQKIYSRQDTLRRHLRLCGFRPHGFVPIPQNADKIRHMLGAVPPNTPKVKPIFDCFVCGKSFNRKDNMLTHRKKCQLKRTTTNADSSAPAQQSFSGGASSSDGPQGQPDSDGNWGIMSLPSVLPRRVTCECGAGFTSPRLLLEHLQKHAQESYTCPTCGETVSTWADYEVHLQHHMHPHHQLYKGLQPQRSQPLLLRFQQQPAQPKPPQGRQPSPGKQPSSSAAAPHRPPAKQPAAVHLLHPNSKQQRIPCLRCSSTFSNRSSLRKHISLNRCKGGGRVASLPKTSSHCSRCNADFPNMMSLVFHQRSGNCKPAFKPIRCSVCVRWFSTVDGLQKHLLTHSQSESHRCDVCHGTYRNLKSLKNHRRRVHRIMAGETAPRTKQEKED